MSGAKQRPQPTVAIGVGRAGIEILDSLARLVDREGENRHYHFIAIDSNEGDLEELAPDEGDTIHLSVPDDYIENDPEHYPYLTGDMEVSQEGAQRQRPVGRYKFDSNGNPDWAKHLMTLYDQTERHFSELRSDFTSAEQLNIFVMHSLGGGTGSGTFPLLNAMVDTIATVVENTSSVPVYQVGVGVTPEVNFDDPGVMRGTDIYFPNAYASFRDLKKLVETKEEGTSLTLPVYSEDISNSRQLSRSDVGNILQSTSELELTSPPFDRYYLMGVDEGRINSPGGGGSYEQYADVLDNAIAEGVYALSRYGDENFFRSRQHALTGTIGQSEVRVPIDRLRQYCNKKQKREELKNRLNNEIPAEITTEEERLQNIRAIRDRPLEAETLLSEDVEEFVVEEFGQRFGAGRAVLRDVTGEDLRDGLETVEDRYDDGLLALPYALADLEGRLDDAAETVEVERADVVSEMWDDHDMIESDTYGDIDPEESTITDKAKNLEDYYRDRIEEYEQLVEETDPAGLVDRIVGTNKLARYERDLSYYRGDLNELISLQEEWMTLRSLRETLREERQSVNRRFQQRETNIQQSISDLEEKERDVSRKLEEIRRGVKSLRDELTSGGLGKRLGYLPLYNLEEIDQQMLENELTDLPSFITEDYVKESEFEKAIDRQLEDANADNNTILNRNVNPAEMDVPGQLFTLFTLHHESLANSEYASYLPSADTIGADDPEGDMPRINDPYRVSFISYLHQGPIEALTNYRRLQEAANSGEFDRMLTGVDYRRSFAYLEWYDREIRKAFRVKDQIELPVPEEMEPARVQGSFDSEGERKSYIVANAFASYLWDGNLAERYDGEDVAFEGWKDHLQSEGITFTQLQSVSPGSRDKSQWLAGNKSWAEILESYRENLIDQEQIDITWQVPEDDETDQDATSILTD